MTYYSNPKLLIEKCPRCSERLGYYGYSYVTERFDGLQIYAFNCTKCGRFMAEVDPQKYRQVEMKVERTGRECMIAASEYKVTFPDGSEQTIWSPPWNEYTGEEMDLEARKFAWRIWENKHNE